MMATEKKHRRPKGDGSVQQLARDKYKVQYTVGYDSKGKQIRKSFTGKSQREALARLTEYKVQQQQGTLVLTNNCKLSEFIDRWLSIKEAQRRRTTYESYKDTCELHIKPALGMHKVQKLTTAHLNDYLASKLKAGKSPATVTRHRAILHSILDLAAKEGIVPRNVVDNCDSIQVKRLETKVLDGAEAKQLLSTAREIYERDKGKANKFSQIYHIVLLSLATGARRGEILALKWDSIDFEKSTITIKENLVEVGGGLRVEAPKTISSRRLVAVDEGVLEYLKELRTNSEWVFCTRDGKPLSPSNVGRAYRKLLTDGGVEGVRFHDLRHTHATKLIADGENPKTVSARLGHNDIRTTLNLYTHALPEEDREAAKKMGSWLLK